MRGEGLLLYAALLAAWVTMSAAQSGDDGVCGNLANVLTTDCSDECDSDEVCVRQVDGDECDYHCQKLKEDDSYEDTRNSTFILLPFGDYKSKWEELHGGEEWWKKKVDSLPNDTSDWTHYSDDVVNTIGSIEVPSKADKIYIQGGSTAKRKYVKGKVAHATFEEGFLEASPDLKAVEFGNIDFSVDYPDFSKMTETKLEYLGILNCQLTELPANIPTMSSLTMLVLTGNLMTAFDADLSWPDFSRLKLGKNNLTSFTAELPEEMMNLDLRHNDLASLDTKLPTKTHELHLEHNSFTSIPTALQNVTKLSIFSFTFNPLTNVNVTQHIFDLLKNADTEMNHEVDTSGCENMKVLPDNSRVCITENLEDMINPGPGKSSDSSSTSLDRNTPDILDKSMSGSLSSSASGSTGIIVSESEDSSSTNVIYIAIPVVAVLLIVIGVLYLKLRKHRQGGKNISTGAATSEKSVFTVGSKYSLWADETMLALQMNNEDVEDVQRIGGGAYGEVWLVLYRRTTYFASKRLVTGNKGPGLATRLVDEIKLASSLDHPNIVELVGAVWTNETDLQALFEYMPNGDLRSYLINPRTPKKWTKEKLRIAVGVAEALVYVHSFLPPLLHRDLKSPNILLSEMNEAKVTDFGVSRYSSEVGTNTTGVGTAKWLAPEALTGDGTYDESSDCYSFGVVLSELDTHELPYFDAQSSSGGEMADVVLLNRVAEGTIQPSFSDTCPPAIRDLGMECLSFNPTERPRATEIAYKLRNILKHHSQ